MIPALCFITDARAPTSIVDQALAAARGGAGWVQLRHKTCSDVDFAALARAMSKALAGTGASLMINDRVEVATAIQAPGLHIGQSDGDPTSVRRRIGPDMILGLSIEAADQLADVPDCVDYLGVGPIHTTKSKPDHAPLIGHAGFAAIAAQTQLPCLAIGGIGASDARPVKEAGGAGLAVVSAISRAQDMSGAARNLITAWRTA